MKYYVRAAGDSQVFGPYSLDDIRQQLSTGCLRPDFEAHPSEGQTHDALKRSTAWLPLLSICPLDTIPVAQPAASSRSPASGSAFPRRDPDQPFRPAASSRSSESGSGEVEQAGVALSLAVFAWIQLVAAPIAGFLVGSEHSAYFGWVIFLAGFVSGLVLLGFARVIEHLCEVAQRLRRIEGALQRATDEKDFA